MKKPRFLITGLVFMLIISTNQLRGQEEGTNWNFTVGADVYSNYIWRGTKFGTGPSVQPAVAFQTGQLTLGVWGSFDAAGYAETDPYISYSLPMGFSVGLTDYYYPGLQAFDFSKDSGSHAFEINAGFEKEGFTLSANYILNEAGGAASAGGDMYFQAGYAFTNIEVFFGAGDGWHTSNGNFNVCNVGIGTSREIQISEKFSVPLSGQVILNPEREQLYVVVGFSF